MNCLPELRDDWLVAAYVDSEIEESVVRFIAVSSLRSLISDSRESKACAHLSITVRRLLRTLQELSKNVLDNAKRYGSMAAFQSLMHQRVPAPEIRTLDTATEPVVQPEQEPFPPPHSRPPSSLFGSPVDIEDSNTLAQTSEYETLLTEVFGKAHIEDAELNHAILGLGNDSDIYNQRAWTILTDILGPTDNISDSESIASIGDLTPAKEEAPLIEAEVNENINTWAVRWPELCIHSLIFW